MTDSDAEPSFRGYLAMLRRRGWWVIVASLLGLGAAIAYSVTGPKEYTATAQMLVESTSGASQPGSAALPVSQAGVQTELALVSSAPVARTVRRELGEVPVVNAAEIGQTNVIAISASGHSGTWAARVANAYARAFVAYQQAAASRSLTTAESELRRQVSQVATQLLALHRDQTSSPQAQALLNQEAVLKEQLAQMEVSGSVNFGGVALVTPAQAPDTPSSPRPVKDGVLGLIAGLLAGIAAAFARETLDDKLASENAVERTAQAPVVSLVPQVANWRRRERPVLTSLVDPMAPTAEAYRSLRTSLQFARQEHDLRTVVVTSPAAAEGKTTTLANLGVVFSQAGENVLVVSCDLRRPRLGEFFGVGEEPGLTSVLLGRASLEDVIVKAPDNERLWVLSAGPVPSNPAELLNSHRAKQIIDMLGDRFDLVLIDSPPVLPVTDAVILSGHADATLMVVRAGQTRRGDLRRAAEKLRQVNANVLGVVLNQVNKQYGYASGYGYGYKPYVAPQRTGGSGSGSGGIGTGGTSRGRHNGSGIPRATAV